MRQHEISDITMCEMKLAVFDLVGCLEQSTLDNLKVLNVKNGTLLPTPLSSIGSSKSLHTLNVRGTELNALDVLVREIPNLKRLDISQTRVVHISPLVKFKDKLVYLAMNNMGLNEQMVDTFHELRHLDVSDDLFNELSNEEDQVDYPINSLFRRENLFPHRVSLDVSGNTPSESNLIENFVHSHPNLKFLGGM